MGLGMLGFWWWVVGRKYWVWMQDYYSLRNHDWFGCIILIHGFMINSNIASKSYIINVLSIWENQNLAKVPIDEFGISFYLPQISPRDFPEAKNDRDKILLKFRVFSAKVHPHGTLAVGLNWGDFSDAPGRHQKTTIFRHRPKSIKMKNKSTLGVPRGRVCFIFLPMLKSIWASFFRCFPILR
jgi:hypothetical protein